MSITTSTADKLRTNYKQLVKLNICSDSGGLRKCGRSVADGVMDLFYKRLPHLDEVNGQKNIAFSIAHYLVENKRMYPEPEMILLFYPEARTVEAYSFQMAIPPIYQCAYSKPDVCCETLFNALNDYLNSWLKTLINQCHGTNWRDYDSPAGGYGSNNKTENAFQ